MASPDDSESLPTRGVTRAQTAILVQSMLVDWRVLEHLQQKGIVEDAFAMRADGCCKPDGGTCCVNAKQF